MWPFSHENKYMVKYKEIYILNIFCRGASAPLGRRMPWAYVFSSFSKSIKGKILNFLHEVEKMITVISVQV